MTATSKRINKGMYWDRAWSLVEGCTPVSPGCENCWAAAQAHMRARQRNEKIRARYEGLTTKAGRWNGHIRVLTENLNLPLRVKKPTVWAIWNDLFHPDVPQEFIWQTFNTMLEAGQHTYLVLTKRPSRMYRFFKNIEDWNPNDAPHIWLGVTAENQEQADMRIPVLLQTPASVRFVSVEPMLGPVNLTRINLGVQKTRGYGSRQIIWDALSGWEKQYETNRSLRSMFQQTPKCMSNDIGGRLNWVICGGETGHGARPMHPDWVRSLRDQAVSAKVPFFFKSWGEWSPGYIDDGNDLPYEVLASVPQPEGVRILGDQSLSFVNMFRVGKKKAGRLLDGREWNQTPSNN